MSVRRRKRFRLFNWRLPVRIDVRRATFAASGVTSALALALVFATRGPPEQVPHIGFGWEWRTAPILFLPLVGDECRQNLFDNDSGAIWQLPAISCADALGLTEKSVRATAEVSHIMLVSRTFRR